MLILVNDLIDLYLIKNDKFKERPVLVNLSTLVQDIYNLVFVQAREKQVIIERRIDSSVDEEVLKFDGQRIRSVLLNLLMNAVKFSRSGGNIVVSVGFASETGDELIISVSDTGIGINEEVKASLFTMFRSLTRQMDFGSAKKESNTNGAGLGLTFCKSMIEQLGGSIWFETTEKVGTTFFIKFPVLIASQRDLATETVESTSTDSVLIEKL